MVGSVESPTPANDNASVVVGIAASAGGFNALKRLLSELTLGFPASILIVQHVAPQYPSHLAELLAPYTTLKIKQAAEGDHLQNGTAYTAAPGQHLVVNAEGILKLTRTELVNFVRPSADVLFNSMASNFGERAIAVVLTGTGQDGAQGVKAIKSAGGKALAQDEATSAFFGMPHAAILTGTIDEILPLDRIAASLVRLVQAL